MKTLFLDIETTGLPPKKAHYSADFDLFPHIVSICWKINGTAPYYIIKPDGYEIPQKAVDIHRITTEQALKEGIPLGLALVRFYKDLKQAKTIVGHGIYFDTSTIKANSLREGMSIEDINKALHKDKRIDTMFKTIKFCGLKQKDSNRPKTPSLVELYAILFDGATFEAHNAKNDVNATERCFNKL
ncbi:MAG: 3'-5' exonuclease, partial [Alphaproteobacteria bacterium]